MAKPEHNIAGATATRRVLLVLFIPSADRDGKTLLTQDEWKRNAMELFGTSYGGATAMPRAEGVWRDDGNGGKLIPDFPILLHCYMTEEQAADKKLQTKVGAFCRKMGKEMKQGEVAFILDGVFYSFTHFG
jgi:hypothetical protein